MKKKKLLDEIRPIEYIEQFKIMFEKDLYDYSKSGKINVNCCVCNYKKTKIIYKKTGFLWKQCCKCGFVFISPRPDFCDIKKFYSSAKSIKFFNEKIKAKTRLIRKEKNFSDRVEYIKNKIKLDKESLILDVGIGLGEFLELLYENNFKKLYGIDFNNYAQPFLKKYKNIRLFNNSFEELKIKLKFDLITMCEFLAHTYNPKKVLEKAHKYLNDNGVLFITTPNIEGLEYQILKENNPNISPVFLNYFSVKSLKTLLINVGFKEKNIEITTPGKIDIDNIEREYIKNPYILKHYQFIKNILNSNSNKNKKELQKYISNNLFSGHMLCIIKK